MRCTQCGHENEHGAAFCSRCGMALHERGQVQTSGWAQAMSGSAPATPDGAHHPTDGLPADRAGYAGFWRRLGAYLVDSLILNTGFVVVAVIVGIVFVLSGLDPETLEAPEDAEPLGIALIVLLYGGSIVASILYFVIMESSARQATIGKLVVGIRVTDEHGKRITFWRALGRYFAKFVSVLTVGIGFLMIAFTPRKQGLHDMIAGTCVIRDDHDSRADRDG